MNPDWHDRFHAFPLAVAERLEGRERNYQGRSFSAEPRALLDEIREELRDVAGWAFVLDCRLARVADSLEHIRGELPEEHPPEDQDGQAHVQNDLAENQPLRMPRGKLEQVVEESPHRFTERGTTLDGETIREFPTPRVVLPRLEPQMEFFPRGRPRRRTATPGASSVKPVFDELGRGRE